jgi:GAF domain-containing protein
LDEAGLLSRIATPLIANDQVVGTLQVTSKEPNAYGELEFARLEIVGNQMAGAIASAIQLQAAKDRASQLESLYDVAAILAQPLRFEDKAQQIVNALASIIGADYVVLRKVDKEEKNLILVASGGFGSMEFRQVIDLSDSNFLARTAYLEGQAILINDY